MNIQRKVLSLLGCLLFVLCCLTTPAFADTPLPDGAVKGLPERLAALDDAGNAVNSATGEYFFHVEGMRLGETYTKNIQLINLCEDKTYHIFFCVEPLFKSGEIDLEQGCSCRFLLDGTQFYSGSVNGAGNIDLTQYYDLGRFEMGESHVLRCEITFHDLTATQSVDNGWRLVDKDGVHVLREGSGGGAIYGEIEFKWIFCARAIPYVPGPRPTEPVPTQPLPTEPQPTQPLPTEPVPTEPLPTEPLPTEPVPTEPLPTEPLPTEPVPSEAPPTQPLPGAPVTPSPVPSVQPTRRPLRPGESYDDIYEDGFPLGYMEGEPDPNDPDNPANSSGGPSANANANSHSYNAPRTGLELPDGLIWLICMGVIAGMICVLLVLIRKQKKQQGGKGKHQ